LLVDASVTDSLVTLATHIIRDLGLGGVALLNICSAVIGIPGTEATMLFSGFNVYDHHLTLLGIIVFGVLGDVVGASIAYAIGRYGGNELLERHGSKLHVSRARLDFAHRWFGRYGAPAIFVSRFIPLVRAIFPYAAGVAEMAYSKFVLFTTLGSIGWITGLGVLGKAVGKSWPHWRHNLEYADYAALAVLVVAIVWFVLRRRGGGPRGDGAAAELAE
jgi:membrane protein DedA with SNARE-associated domain